MANKAKLKTVDAIRSHLHRVLRETTNDPPDTRFLLGFYSALEELERLMDTRGYDRGRKPSWR